MLTTYSDVTFNEGILQLNLLCDVHKKCQSRFFWSSFQYCLQSERGNRSFPSNTQHLLDSCHFSKHAFLKLPSINALYLMENTSITMYYSPLCRTEPTAGHKQGTAVEITLALIPE